MSKTILPAIVLIIIAFSVLAENHLLRRFPLAHATVQGVALGSTNDEVIKFLGEPIEKRMEPPQFGNLEITYVYDGLFIHTTDNSVEQITINSSEYRLGNGLRVGSTKEKFKEIFGLEDVGEKLSLYIGEGNSCFSVFDFKDHLVFQINIYCAG
jgi:hypothetical protein